ncbi:hypothetical protein GGS24DRAFT_247357 [Hypoxylon argillaceum]|nr:hypothetical protein GGS24DRAFT_247357 [Hypoxylon argillaceum]
MASASPPIDKDHVPRSSGANPEPSNAETPDQVQQEMKKAGEDVEKLRRQIEALEHNPAARPWLIEPLRTIAIDEVEDFPRNAAEIDEMQELVIDRVLSYLRQPTIGSLLEKRRRLKTVVGVLPLRRAV